MKQHNYQKARLKLFEDKRINKIWLFSKSGGRPFPVPTSKVTAEMDFQKPHLELFQAKIEKRAARAFQKEGKWEPRDYEAIIEWTVLHLIRNRKSRREFFASAEDYNNRFISEFYKELTISHDRYPNVDIHESKEDRFLLTADHPMAELQVPGENDYVRCFAKSPNILIVFSGRSRPPEFAIPVEDYFNAMIYSLADELIFSDRSDVSLTRLKEIAETFEMSPVIGT